jgi:hypothetical protein
MDPYPCSRRHVPSYDQTKVNDWASTHHRIHIRTHLASLDKLDTYLSLNDTASYPNVYQYIGPLLDNGCTRIPSVVLVLERIPR